jgi:hypothetical protein
VDADGHVLRYQIVRPEAVNSEEFPVFGNEQAGPPERRSQYELHLPYTIVLLDLYFADYAAASAAAAEAGALVGATFEHSTGGVVIAFAQILDDA